MKSKKVKVILFAIIILGGLLRFWGNTTNPVSLNIDEVAIGYDAYSILETSRDQYGNFLPLSFESVGDYKPPLMTYLTVPSIYFFGLNEFSVRLPAALIATLGILVYFFLFKEITKNDRIALIAAFLLSISPWHIYYSRYSSESVIALTFLGLGMYGLLVLLRKDSKWWAVISSFFLSFSMYAYHAERLFVPLLLTTFLIIYRSTIFKQKHNFIVFILSFIVFSLPLVNNMFFGEDATRAQTTIFTQDIEYSRTVAVDINNKFQSGSITGETVLPFIYWARKYLNYFRPSFLFYNGLNMTAAGSYGLGVMYLFEVVFLLYGLYLLIFDRFKNKALIFSWLLLGIIPASLAQSEQHPLRSMAALPMFVLVSAIGAYGLHKYISKNLNVYLRRMVYIIFSGVFVWSIIHAYITFSVYLPHQRGEAFMEGTKEVVMYVLDNEDKYDEIVFDPKRGTDGPYTVSIPHMYLLFYSKYDPAEYQKIEKRYGDDEYGFDKYTVRNIDWQVDGGKTGTLFVGTPWSLQDHMVEEDEVLKRIYMTNGVNVFVIATPNGDE